MFVTLGHILFGTASYEQGNVRLIARAAGERGLKAIYVFSVGGVEPVVAVDFTIGGAGRVTVTAPSSTTESQLVTALRAAPGFFQLFGVDLIGGDGATLISSTVTQPPIVDGLLQLLQTRIPLPGPGEGVGQQWGDRDLIATERPVGLLWPASGRFVRFNPEDDGTNEYEGKLMIGFALSLKTESFHAQNQVLDFYRRKLSMALTIFKHDGWMGVGPVEWGNTNTEKDEVAGTPLEQARVRVVFSCDIKWSEPSRDDEDRIYTTLQPPLVGLWREPLTDELGGGGTGGEDLDTILHVNLQE